MASTVEQAWALPVGIAKLGAHLTVYVNLGPTIDTLRLCNQFGRGGQGITRLPIELIKRVEEYLFQAECEQESKVWTSNQECAEGSCRQFNRLNDDAIHRSYHELQRCGIVEYSAEDRLCVVRERHLSDAHEECFTCRALGPSEPHSQEDIANQRAVVADYLDQVQKTSRNLGEQFHRLGESVNRYDDTCFDSLLAWSAQVGGLIHRGRTPTAMQGLSKVLRKDFGLEIRIAHEPWTSYQDGMQSVYERPTTAYLRLPVEDSAKGRGNLRPATPARLARFARAVRILGLEVVAGAEELDVNEQDVSHINGKDILIDQEDFSTEPRVTTFAEYADAGGENWVWADDYFRDPDKEVAWNHYVEEGDWLWAVVKN